MHPFLEKLRQRRMIQWLIAYLASAWIIIEAAELFADIFFISPALLQGLVWLLVFGFFAALVLAWFHGEKNRQRVSGLEAALLALIIVAAGIFLAVYDYEVTSEPTQAVLQNPFAGLSTRRVTASRGIDGEPAWSPDGSSLAFSSARGGNADLWVEDLGGQARQLTFDDAEDVQPAWSPDGRHILFVSSRGISDSLDRSVTFGYSLGGGIWRIPVLGGDAVRVLDDAYNPAWAPDGKRFAYDSSHRGPRRIFVVDADGTRPRAVSQDTSDLAMHTRPAWSPDGRWIVYERQEGSQSQASELWIIPAEGGQGRALTGSHGRNFSPAWNGADAVVFSSDSGGAINLWRQAIDSDTGEAVGNPEQITLGQGEDIDPAVSSAGRLAYVSQQRLFNLWQVRLDPSDWTLEADPEQIFDTVWNDYAPALSADGERLAFVSDREGEVDVWVTNPGAAEPVRLTQGTGQKLQPVWSPDGTILAYFSNQAGNNDIWLVPAFGGAPVQLTTSPADDINPYWSPDGSRIAFVSDRSGQSEVWVMDADGANEERLTQIGVTGHTARWSPNGNWILFTSMSTGDREIWAVPADGGEPLRLTEFPSQDAHGLWSPQGDEVFYLSDHHTLWVQPFEGGERTKVFTPGDRIDYTHLSADGTRLLFTRERVEADIWLME
jgi:Tol biopolymer transport system component